MPSGTLYTVLVLMAIATTLLTQPLLALVNRFRPAVPHPGAAADPEPAAAPRSR